MTDRPPIPKRQPIATESIFTTLLKAPEQISHILADQRDLLTPSLVLFAMGLLCHAVFGLALGLFNGWTVAAMAILKIPMVATGALVLCLPSLYVFSCVAGSPLSFSQTLALGCACLAMIGLLLVGLAPVAWLFAVSTASLPFMVILAFILWLIAIIFASRFVGKLRANPLFQRQAGIKIWFFIFILVTLQMTTCLRPILTKAETGWWTGEKKFFLSHFGSVIEKKK